MIATTPLAQSLIPGALCVLGSSSPPNRVGRPPAAPWGSRRGSGRWSAEAAGSRPVMLARPACPLHRIRAEDDYANRDGAGLCVFESGMQNRRLTEP